MEANAKRDIKGIAWIGKEINVWSSSIARDTVGYSLVEYTLGLSQAAGIRSKYGWEMVSPNHRPPPIRLLCKAIHSWPGIGSSSMEDLSSVP